MNPFLEKFKDKIDGMSLRERVLIFAAAAFILVALAKTLFLDPLLTEKRLLSAKVQQQQEKMKALQVQLAELEQARKAADSSPLRQRLADGKQKLAEGEVYLQGRRSQLVAPEKMAELLQHVLDHNGHLRLMNLETLPVTPLKMVKSGATAVLDKQIFNHGVKMTVHGSYLDLLQYLAEIEKLPTQMYWGDLELKVIQYPDVELKFTVYTLSLDKIWLKI